MENSYTLYLDESGNDNVTGKTLEDAIFFLGGVLIKNSQKNIARGKIQKIEHEINKELHFSSIRKHNKKTFAFEQISKMPITCFSLISHKPQLGSYKSRAEKKSSFYNKNFKYLLESVGHYCKQNNIQVSSIVPEKREQNDYGKLMRYLVAVRDDTENVRQDLPYKRGNYQRAENLASFNFENIITPKAKNDDSLLKLADGVCYAVRKLFIPDSLDIIVYRYFHEIRPKFFHDKGCLIGNGLIPVRQFGKMPLHDKTNWYLEFLQSEHYLRRTA